jgi:hypothetical protein
MTDIRIQRSTVPGGAISDATWLLETGKIVGSAIFSAEATVCG